MRKIFVIVIAVIAIVSILAVLNYFSMDYINNKMNDVVNPVNLECNVDEDCKKSSMQCSGCSGGCANKNWQPICLFPATTSLCAATAPYDCKCLNNTCEQVYLPSSVLQ